MSTAILYPGFRKNEPTAAGRAIVTAASAAVQRGLLGVYSATEVDNAIVDFVTGGELIAAIATREPIIAAGTESQYLRGDKTWATLNQAAVAGLTTADSPTFAAITIANAPGAIASFASSLEIRGPSNWIGINFQATGPRVGGRLTIGPNTFTPNVDLYGPSANLLEQRNGTNPQISRLFKSHTSSSGGTVTNGEWLEFDAAGNADNFRIAACRGSLGGDPKGLQLGVKNEAGVFAPWLSFNTSGELVTPGSTVTENIMVLSHGRGNTNDQLAIRFQPRGTSNPSARSEIRSTGLSSLNSDLSFWTQGSERMRIGASGNLLYFGSNIRVGDSDYGSHGIFVSSTNTSSTIAFEINSSGSADHIRVRSGSDPLLYMPANGNVGIGLASPTAVLHLKAGTASPNTAPLKLTAGSNLTTPENGAIEFDGSNLYITIGGTRRTIQVV